MIPSLAFAHNAAAAHTDTLKVETTLEGAARAGLEERLGASSAAPTGADVSALVSGMEETSITEKEAPSIVKGWADLSVSQQGAVLQSLKERDVTVERYNQMRSILLTPPQTQTGTFAGFPPALDATTPQGADYVRLMEQGGDRAVRQSQGVIIAAAGEGSRLLEEAGRQGLIPPDWRKKGIVKPMVQASPVRGASPLQIQLETLAAEAERYQVPLPVVPVIHEEAIEQIQRWAQEHQDFGLKNLRFVVVSMNPSLDSSGQIVLRDDQTVAFNPNGTGGVILAALKPDLEGWFQNLLGPEGRLFFSNGDMLLSRKILALVTGASKEAPLVGVAYPYPIEEDPKKPHEHRFKLGTFAKVNRQGGQQRVEIIEYKERGTIAGFSGVVEKREKTGQFVQANSGLYVFPLQGLAKKAADLAHHVQRDKDAVGVTGKVNKLEYFVPDLVGMHPPESVKLLMVPQAELVPIKDPTALKQVREQMVERERDWAQGLGIELSPEARVEFHPDVVGRVQAGKDVRIDGPVGVLFDKGGVVKIYTRPQPDQPWEPFDPSSVIISQQLAAAPGQPIVIPDGTVFSLKGMEVPSGLEEAAKIQESVRVALHPDRATESVSGVRIKDLQELQVAEGAQRAAALYGYHYLDNLLQRWETAGWPKSEVRIVLVRDSRPSGEWLAPEIVRGLIAAAQQRGVKIGISDVGVAPKPFFLEYIRAGRFDGGVDLTASHNDTILFGPIEFNGWEFSTGAVEPLGSTIQGGALLNSETADQVIGAVRQLQDKEKLSSFTDIWNRITAIPDEQVAVAMDLPGVKERQKQMVKEEWRYVVASLKKNFGIDVNEFPVLVKRARASGRLGKEAPVLVFDDNGSAAGRYYPPIWQGAGIPVQVINPTMTHKPIPEGENLEELQRAIQKLGALFGVAVDVDADRGQAPEGQGTETLAVTLGAQHGATAMVGMSIVLALRADPNRKIAVVVNDTPSQQIYKVTDALGVPRERVKVVEVGEANLAEEKQHWETQGYWTIASELSNGGILYPDGRCRDACLLGFLKAYLALNPEPFLMWLDRSGQSPTSERRRQIENGQYTLVDISRTFPWEGHSDPQWRYFTTSTESPRAKLTAPQDVKDKLGGDLGKLDWAAVKRGMIQLFERYFWPPLKTQGYSSYRILHTKGRRTTEGNDIPPGGAGGFSILLTRAGADGPIEEQAWLRRSGTEAGVVRVFAGVVEEGARKKFLEEMMGELFFGATRIATGVISEQDWKPAAGLEEEVSNPVGEWAVPDWKKALGEAVDLIKRIEAEIRAGRVQEAVAVDPDHLARFLEEHLKGAFPSAAAVGVLSEFSDIFGWNPQLIAAELERAGRLLQRFEAEHGKRVEPVYFGWAPGRWMFGGHGDYNGLDEFGGTLQAGMMVIARARGDRQVVAASTSMDPGFAKGSFDLAEEFQPGNVWTDLVQGSVRYAQNQFPEEPFRGMEILVDSDIPGRGQSSSTALVVGSMMAALSLNGKPWNPEKLVVWCAEAERWGALTRGGQADQSFILLSKRGKMMKVGPNLGSRSYFSFPPTHRLVVLDSRVAPDKTGDTRISFNQQSAQTQLLGFELLKARFLRAFPGHVKKILSVQNLRELYDLAVELKLEKNLLGIVKNLPKATLEGNIAKEISEIYRKVQKSRTDLEISIPDVKLKLAQLYPDVPAPPGGWRIKPRMEHLFLLLDLVGRMEVALEEGDMEEFGAVMVDELRSLDVNYEVVNKEHTGLLASYAQEAGVTGVTGQGDFGGNVLALVSKDDVKDLIDYLFDKYYSRGKFRAQGDLFNPPPAVLVAASSRAASPIRPRLPRLEDSLPQKILQAVDLRALPHWVSRLSEEADPALFRLYGWLKELPAGELQELLQRYAEIYPSFVQHIEESRQKLVDGKSQAREGVTLKPDRTWVSGMDQKIQWDFNRLVVGDGKETGQFPFVTVVGEEIPGPTKSVGGDFLTASWVAFRDPLDGTSNYISKDGQRNQRYLSTLRLDYRGKDGVLRPLLTVVVAPEFLGGRPVWLVAGLGIDGVLVNGEIVTPAARKGSPSETIAGINNLLLDEGHPDYRFYHQAVKGMGFTVASARDNMGLFQIPLGQMNLFLAPPQAPWDSRPAEHLVMACGGSVTTLQGRPYPLNNETLARSIQERGEFLLFSGNNTAGAQVTAAYQAEMARLEAQARVTSAQMLLAQTQSSGEADAYQRDLLDAEGKLDHRSQPPPETKTGLEETFERTSTGAEASTWTLLRTRKNLLELPPDVVSRSGVGIIAGPEDPKGVAMAVALSRLLTDRKEPIPMVLVVRSDRERQRLESLKLPLAEVIQVGGFYGGQFVRNEETAWQLADRWLKSFWGIRPENVLRLGTDRPVPDALDVVLRNLGVVLTPEILRDWEDFVSEMRTAISA